MDGRKDDSDAGVDGGGGKSPGRLGGAEALHQRLGTVGNGWLRSRTVGGGDVTSLFDETSAKELIIFGHQNSPSIALGVDDGAGEL